MPAIRATRVPPIAALREGAVLPRSRFARYTPFVAALLTALGILLLVIGIFANISSAGQRLSLIGAGAALLFLGVAMLSPKLVGPLADVIGWPIDRATNITGRLARENAVRNPGRTAVTAAALMIGLALVGFVTIFAAELVKTADDAINRNFAGSFIIATAQRSPIPGGVKTAVAHVPGVGAVSAIKLDAANIQGMGGQTVAGIQPQTIRAIYRFQWKKGSAATLSAMAADPHAALVDDTTAGNSKLHVGSIVHVTTTVGVHDSFTIIGIYKNNVLFSGVGIPYDTFQRDWRQRSDFELFLSAAPGANIAATKARLAAVLKTQFPAAQVQTTADLKKQQQTSLNQLLALIYLLLAMSVFVSLFGIINTLVLSVYERTREIGMLRAIGTTRRQVAWMVRWESVITSVIGAVLGLVLGIVLAMLVTAGLSSQGIEQTIPIGQLLIWVVFAILFGIVAAIFPARRAARLDVLEAVSYE
jgi:putative ABC transport system permease protein